ncbi:MAG: hypothetical protein FWC41_08545 [Firmicutes bacterium]|nr:hypothetical protein [Bacillota bacterium]
MDYIMDIVLCGLITAWQFTKVIIIALAIQGIIYRITGTSIYNEFTKIIMKEVQ